MTRVTLPFVQPPPAEYLGYNYKPPSRQHVVASYWTAASDVAPTSATVNDVRPPVNGGGPPINGENPRRTLGDYSKPSHEGYRNTIEIPDGNNVVPLRSDIIRLALNDQMMGALPSDMIKNPNLNPNSASFARSYPTGDPQSSFNPFKSVNAIQMCVNSTTNIQKDRLQVNTLTINEIEIATPKETKKAIEDEFVDLHLNLTVLEVLAHVSIYDALLDKYIVNLEMGNGSEYIQSIAPEKMKDPRLFILPCRLGDSKPFDTLGDLGSCVNLIPLSLFKKLKIWLLEETNNVLGLTDGTK
nr:hypothetical protein [Tanacetum cinerariifolium]GEV08248.1 hypothetical protein [Tanacetum cinerariifolium]